jgi:FKBP-type peptidyl-prolyl cis-trans isomerase (trigger factor)
VNQRHAVVIARHVRGVHAGAGVADDAQRFAIQWLMEEEKIEASPQEVAALRDQMMATVPEKERSKAEAYYKEGSEGYEELKWRRRVEKLVEGMLAR